MQLKRLLFRLGFMAMLGLVILSMGGPVSEAAAPPVLVDTAGPNASDCGKYSGKPVTTTDLAAAINGAVTGQTILICPGTYTLTGNLVVNGLAKLTIKRATTGPGSRPVLDIDNASGIGLNVFSSAVTIDGLVIDGRGNGASYIGIYLDTSAATIKNATILGPDQPGGVGILADNGGQPVIRSLAVSATNILGYRDYGIFVAGRVKLSVTGSTLDGSDGGRITSPWVFQSGVYFNGGPTFGETPSGSVSKSRIVNNYNGVVIGEVSKISVSTNTFYNNGVSVRITAGDLVNNADNTKVTGNQILGVPAEGVGILIENINVPVNSIKNTSISKNVIVAAQYGLAVLPPTAVYIAANAPAQTLVTVTLSSNTLLGFLPGNRVINESDRAKVTEKGTDATP